MVSAVAAIKTWFHPELFPLMQVMLSLGSAVGYAMVGDWRRVVYWTAAAIITLAVTL